MKKWTKVLVIVLASIIALILLVAILISPIAKSYIEKNDKELLALRKKEIENKYF